MTDTYGLTFYAPLGKWDHDSRSWKTSEATSLWALTLSSLTLPTWGGLHDGELFELPTPALATSEPDCSSLPTPVADNSRGLPQPGTAYSSLPNAVVTLLNTPRARLEGNSLIRDRGHGFLEEQIANLPTPTSRDWKGHNQRGDDTCLTGALLPTPTSQAAKHGELSPVERKGNRPQDNGNLWVVMPRLAEEALLPTPAVNDMGEGKTLEWWDDWAPRQKSSDGRPAPHGKSLAIEAMRMLPTPMTAYTSRDVETWREQRRAGNG